MSAQAVTGTATSVSDAAWKAIEGGYDLQVHVAPDVIERRIDDIDLAHEFLKRKLQAFGAITLNHSVGGLNPVAVELSGRSGAKIVWMPTVDAANETAGRVDGPSTKLPFWAKIQRELAAQGISPPPLTVLDDKGNLNEAS